MHPQRIGHFEIQREVARGGMGVVYQAYDTLLGRQVALKVLLEAGRALRRERFVREMRALAQLRHPNIVPVFSAGEHGDHLYVVMELIEGESLQQRLDREGAIPPLEATQITGKLAQALHHAHCSSLLHRDVKPDNVLLRADGEPLLTDFGLALELDTRSAGRLSQTGVGLGTPGYWPPEQARGDMTAVGPASDVYSLGATLYAALTGTAPFCGPFIEQLQATIGARPTPPSAVRAQVDEQLEAICLRCLEKDPSDRYPSAKALADALTVAASPLEGPRRSGRIQDRHRREERSSWKLATGGLVLLLAVGVGVAVGINLQTPPPSVATPPSSPASTPDPPSPPVEVDEDPAESLSATEWFDRGKQFEQGGDAKAALEAYERSIEVDPTHVGPWIGAGIAHHNLGDELAALRAYNGALRLQPNDTRALINRGVSFAVLEDYATAALEFERALAFLPPGDPLLPSARRMLADAQAQVLGNQTQFTSDQLSVAAEPLGPEAEALFARANQDYARQDLQAALAGFTRLLELEPDSSAAHNSRGVVWMRLGDPAAGKRDFDRALSLNPNQANAYMNRSHLHSDRGDWQAAIADISAFLALVPDHPWAYHNRGIYHSNVGDYRAAISDFDRSLEINPQHVAAYDKRAEAWIGLRDRRRAVEDWTRYLEARPASAAALANRGNVRYKLGDQSGGIADLTLAAQLVRPDDPQLPMLERVLERLQQEAAAAE